MIAVCRTPLFKIIQAGGRISSVSRGKLTGISYAFCGGSHNPHSFSPISATQVSESLLKASTPTLPPLTVRMQPMVLEQYMHSTPKGWGVAQGRRSRGGARFTTNILTITISTTMRVRGWLGTGKRKPDHMRIIWREGFYL